MMLLNRKGEEWGEGDTFSLVTGRKKMETRRLLAFISRYKHYEWLHEFHRGKLTIIRHRHKGFIAPI